ncbi:hypothetical protein IW262DRAFT_1400198 [Armillaria fumosa]|nr:hypothetical protein IW262DRAFT_1400198 [Armillaria fumosa]
MIAVNIDSSQGTDARYGGYVCEHQGVAMLGFSSSFREYLRGYFQVYWPGEYIDFVLSPVSTIQLSSTPGLGIQPTGGCVQCSFVRCAFLGLVSFSAYYLMWFTFAIRRVRQDGACILKFKPSTVGSTRRMQMTQKVYGVAEEYKTISVLDRDFRLPAR